MLKNPVMTASGTFGYGLEFADFMPLDGIGGIIVKGTTLKPREGNDYPRMAETASGMLNCVGLQNKGVDYFCEHIYPQIKDIDTHMIVNVSGSSPEDYAECAARIDALERIPAIELNISCPHAMDGYGASIGQDCNLSHKIVSASKDAAKIPIIAKLTPNVTDITEIAKTCEEAGADALSLINTLGPGMKINIDVARPVLFHKSGGMSGRAIKPIAISNVYSVYEAVDIPLIGVGGIYTFEDVVEFIFAGARAVQIGTAIMDEGVTVFDDINKGLEKFMAEKGYSSIDEMVGIAHREL